MPINKNGYGPFPLGQFIRFPIYPIIGRYDIDRFIPRIDQNFSRISP